MSISKKYCFLLIYLLIPLPFIGLNLGGWYSFIYIFILFAFIPCVDSFIRDAINPSPEQENELIQDKYFKYIVSLYVPAQVVMLLYSVYLVSNYHFQWFEWMAFTTSIGLISGGAGINLAHEMMHKNDPIQQFFSKILLVTVCYGHFFIEHVKGHHVRVATPADPATAQFGESFYHFLPKTMVGSFKSAFHFEQSRLRRKEYSLLSYHNHFWWIILVPSIIAIACFIYGGATALVFFLLQSFIAIMTLELVNYIEHYGLERIRLPSGEYEKVKPCHSWSANHWLSNILLFHTQRHSDHHTYGARPYQILRHIDQGPQLPSGFYAMIVIALIPPLWRSVMDKRVIAYTEQLQKNSLQSVSIDTSLR